MKAGRGTSFCGSAGINTPKPATIIAKATGTLNEDDGSDRVPSLPLGCALASISGRMRAGVALHSALPVHAACNPHQSDIYEREAAVAKRDAEQQKKLEEKRAREIAAQGAQTYRETLRAYVVNWNKKRKVSSGTEMSDDQESEPK